MRLKITLENRKLILPINYQHTLQGLIYHLLEPSQYSNFVHNVGYRSKNKIFKNFVFSNLFGHYEIHNYEIHFSGKIYFYIASSDLLLLHCLVKEIKKKQSVDIYKQSCNLINLEMEELNEFEGVKQIKIKSMSPCVAYQIDENQYVHYFKPSSSIFEEICIQNLERKNEIVKLGQIVFKINNIIYEKKRMVHYKNTFYESYMLEMIVDVNYAALSLIFNTGLSAKGSAGFGMMEIDYETNNIPL